VGQTSDDKRRILRPGDNCWRIARATRFAVIVDAEAYFRAVKEAILQARDAVYLIGWDFDTRVEFERGEKTLEGPNTLGAFIRWIDKNRSDLRMYILKWDLGMLFEVGRGTTPLAMLGWLTSNRINLRLDSAHPLGAAQHQKIVVIDDILAFCGGIDITVDRWDTPLHIDDDERRRRANGKRYGPWHDATAAVEGEAAQALGELARTRWFQATGERVAPPATRDGLWPTGIDPLFAGIEVGIARTVPSYGDIEAVGEIEALYLEAIARADTTIYCESQYFASRRIAEAMAARLREPNGPEIIVVNPESADGFLEAAAMDTARARLLKMIDDADSYDRFRILTPVTSGRQPIYVHAKIVIVDDRLLRVGSSNFNNRSLGFDVECDLAVEASAHDEKVRRSILDFRHDLLAEHLGATAFGVSRAVDANSGSVIRAIETLMNPGKSLVPYVPDEPNAVEAALDDSELLDPERFVGKGRRLSASLRLNPFPLR
jgi:phospholipase D1/2